MTVSSELFQDAGQIASAKSPSANSPSQLRERVTEGKVSWLGPIVIVTGRTVLIVLAQAVFAILFLLRGRPHAWLAAAPWWSVYGTLVDLGCLVLLWHFTRREGLRLRDLIGPVRFGYGRDVWLGMAILMGVLPLFVVGGLLSCRLIYGAYQVNVFPGILGGRVLPLWAFIYTRTLWWLIWSPTEEMTYAGYALPRLQALCGRTWPAVLLVGFWWAIQHAFLPFLPEWRNFVWRFLAFIPGVVAFSLIYLRMRRLGPLILAHWAMDFFATVMTMA